MKIFFKLHRPVGRAVTRLSVERQVQDSNLGQVKSDTVPKFLRKEMWYPDAITRRWATPTRYTLWRIIASIMKDLIDLIS